MLLSSKSQLSSITVAGSIIIHTNVFLYSTTLWPQIQGGQLGGTGGIGAACVPEGSIVLFFGANEELVFGPDDEVANVVTRSAVIKPLDLRQATVPGKQT